MPGTQTSSLDLWPSRELGQEGEASQAKGNSHYRDRRLAGRRSLMSSGNLGFCSPPLLLRILAVNSNGSRVADFQMSWQADFLISLRLEEQSLQAIGILGS